MSILVILNKVCFGIVGAHDMVEKGFDGCRPSNAYYSNDFSHSFYEQNLTKSCESSRSTKPCSWILELSWKITASCFIQQKQDEKFLLTLVSAFKGIKGKIYLNDRELLLVQIYCLLKYLFISTYPFICKTKRKPPK